MANNELVSKYCSETTIAETQLRRNSSFSWILGTAETYQCQNPTYEDNEDKVQRKIRLWCGWTRVNAYCTMPHSISFYKCNHSFLTTRTITTSM